MEVRLDIQGVTENNSLTVCCQTRTKITV